ncbi:hypothetical protein DV737_g75, partial [Chaetothyriales sp. CBS 132003]
MSSSSWQPGPTPYIEKLDNRAPPQPELGPPPHYGPPPTGYPPPPSREGAVYPPDPGYSRQNSVSGPSRSPAEPPRHQYPAPVSTGHEPPYYAPPGLPDYARPAHAYGPPEHQANGNHPPLHLQTGPDMMHAGPGGHPAPHPGYGPPASAGPPPTPGAYPWQYDDRTQRRRPVRAAQACDSCRQRKAKCDEGRPECQHCKDNNLKCTYREIPPQKSEKQVLAITERLENLSDQISQLASNQKAQDDKLDSFLRSLNGHRALLAESAQMKREDSHAQQTPQDVNISFVSEKPAHDDGDAQLEFSMPLEHTTGVHNLMEWPSIRALIPPNQSTTYVMDTEASRGILRLYGCGEGEDRGDGHEGAPSPAQSASSESRRTDDETSSLSSQSVWGNGQLLVQPLISENQTARDHPGGLSPNGGLMLDSQAVDKYFRAYMDNMHILHPFLEPKVMRSMVQTFKRRYSWDLRVARAAVGHKRKREMADSPSSLDESATNCRGRRPSGIHAEANASIEHSVANAIILLVLALGKICLHKTPLPGAVNPAWVRTTMTPQHVYYSDFPPRTTVSTPGSPFKEGMDVNGGTPQMTGSLSGHGQVKNMDVIPGLAYFAKAADILGEFPGGADISHVQANLLAGLYMGQLARVFPSHHYISVACHACQILIKSTEYKEGKLNEAKMSKSRRNLINFAFWSCLQLESDILAEVDLPPSGITRYEGRQHQEMPTGITLDAITEPGGHNDILRFYSYQVQLRRTMNDIHSMLYGKGKKATDTKNPTFSLIDILDENMENWRRMLGDWDWDDNKYESPDINVARMRAKYYGGKYIIHRPCLQWLLTDSVPVIPRSQHSGSPYGTQQGSPYGSTLQPGYSPPGKGLAGTEMGPPEKVADGRSHPRVLDSARRCVEAAIRSTTVFDSVPPRPIVTNIFGTAHAQFGNMLVLSATYTSSRRELRDLLSEPLMRRLLDRTIKLLQNNAKISPVLAKDANILRCRLNLHHVPTQSASRARAAHITCRQHGPRPLQPAPLSLAACYRALLAHEHEAAVCTLTTQVDTTRGPPLRILCLDGGGVRGYSMLIILQELMHRVYVETEGRPPKREELPKPCEYFDLIAGTGTGGLIAIMLGRLRLDLETCMDVYVRMTKKVFETDKTIAGIPYKQTLFKASKLEEAIKSCVREHTVLEDEGNDGTATGGKEFQDLSMPSPVDSGGGGAAALRRSVSVHSGTTIGINTAASPSAVGHPARNSTRSSARTLAHDSVRASMFSPGFARWGNENASLYDGRENRTKTAVTAVYKGTNPKTGSSILLRSYDSRKEPPPESYCTIWQAGRATCATGLAFKPIRIGQSVFTDEGAAKYNPSPQILDEAATNEWPGREIGMFVSVGTGKRPAGSNNQQHDWWEGFVGGTVGNFAEARRRLIAKIEACEDTHIQMLMTELPRRGIPLENYCRLNVEVGVGEFGMNEWDRLSEMTVSTRHYLRRSDTQSMLENAAVRMAKIELLQRRWNHTLSRRYPSNSSIGQDLPLETGPALPPVPLAHEGAVELPVAEDEHVAYALLRQPHPTQPPYPDDGHSYSGRQTSVGGDRLPPYPDTDGPPPIVSKLRKPEYTQR